MPVPGSGGGDAPDVGNDLGIRRVPDEDDPYSAGDQGPDDGGKAVGGPSLGRQGHARIACASGMHDDDWCGAGCTGPVIEAGVAPQAVGDCRCVGRRPERQLRF